MLPISPEQLDTTRQAEASEKLQVCQQWRTFGCAVLFCQVYKRFAALGEVVLVVDDKIIADRLDRREDVEVDQVRLVIRLSVAK